MAVPPGGRQIDMSRTYTQYFDRLCICDDSCCMKSPKRQVDVMYWLSGVLTS